MLVFYAILALLFTPPETCAPIAALVGGTLEPWRGYPEGWTLPDDLAPRKRIDFADGGVIEYAADSEPGTRWLFVFLDYEATADANGEHYGQHNFCGPYRITDD